MIENTNVSFLMTGSSARKLRRGHANMLAGRAWRYTMTPLSWVETEGFELEDICISGLLPPHFTSPDPIQDLRAYVADYLKEEIAAEATGQNSKKNRPRFRGAALAVFPGSIVVGKPWCLG